MKGTLNRTRRLCSGARLRHHLEGYPACYYCDHQHTGQKRKRVGRRLLFRCLARILFVCNVSVENQSTTARHRAEAAGSTPVYLKNEVENLPANSMES